MRKKVLTACAVVCTLSVLSMICLGQIKKNRSISPLAAANVEALTGNETPYERTCYDRYDLSSSFWHPIQQRFRSCEDCKHVDGYNPTNEDKCWD